MVRTIIENSRPEKVPLIDLNDGCGFIYNGCFYVKTGSTDETCGCRLLCVNVKTWEIACVYDDTLVIPCEMEMNLRGGGLMVSIVRRPGREV